MTYVYFIMESFIYQREELSAAHGISGNLLLMRAKIPALQEASSVIRTLHFTFVVFDSFFSL